MAQYTIRGTTYTVSDSLTGDRLSSMLGQLAAQTPKEASAPAPTDLSSDGPVVDRMTNIRALARETDDQLGFPAGTSFAQIQQESNFDSNAVSKRKARGIAQVMPETQKVIEERFGRKLDPTNDTDSMLMHRELMRENMVRFKNPDDAMRAYNGGWNPKTWGNPETSAYVGKVKGHMQNEGVATPGTPATYSGFGEVRKDVDPATLNKDESWINASKQLYLMKERKAWAGSDAEVAEYGKDQMGYFNFNLVRTGYDGYELLKNGTQKDKEAFLFLMDTYDNTKFSKEGAVRAAKGIATDPTNYAQVVPAILSGGATAVARVAAGQAAKEGLKNTLLQSIGRAGLRAGYENAAISAADNAIRQGIEVDAGRKESIDAGELATATGIGAVAGVALGTAGDLAAGKISKIIKGYKERKAGPAPRVEPTAAPHVDPAIDPTVAPHADPVPPTGAAAPVTEPIPTGNTHVDPTASPHGTEAPIPGHPSELLPEAHGAPGEAPLSHLADDALTPEEVRAAGARRQEGRLAVDDNVVYDGSKAVHIDVPDLNSGLRHTPVTPAETKVEAQKITDQLRAITDVEVLGHTVEVARAADRSREGHKLVDMALQLLAREMKIEHAGLVKKMLTNVDSPEFGKWKAAREALEKRMEAPVLADDAAGSAAGSTLNQRRGDVFVESIDELKAQGLSQAEAEHAYVNQRTIAEATQQVQDVAAKSDPAIDVALAAGDFAEAGRLRVAKQREVNALIDSMTHESAAAAANSSDKEVAGAVANSGKRKGAGFWNIVKEVAIANVFTLKTMVVNFTPSAVKTVTVPLVRAMNKDVTEKAVRAEMFASYKGMAAMTGGAWQAFKSSLKYEAPLLTRGETRLMEGQMAVPGRIGGGIRTIPRLLNATDEMLSQFNYGGHVSGKAAFNAAIEGTEKGLTGKALDEHITKAVKNAMDNAFKQSSADEMFDPIFKKGLSLGYSGEDLLRYVEKEAVKNPEALRKGSDEAALDFVKDVLYKRAFSGTGVLSDAAQRSEGFLAKYPWIGPLTGQLFMRTPIRVFEEGVRLTPGLQFAAPGFLRDLAGKNGADRMVRAKGEVMAGLTVTGAVMVLFAQGKLTGNGAYDDYKQDKLRGDTAGVGEYALKFADGSSMEYRGLDPIAVPVKIMVNGMEQANKLAIRQAQGEYIGKSDWDKAYATVSVGLMAITSAFKDANLVAGATGTWDIMTAAGDPEGKEDKWLKLLGEKMKLLVPNTLAKLAKEHDPEMKDPANFWQMVDARMNPYDIMGDIKTSKSYTVLGTPRSASNAPSLTDVTSPMYNPFSVTTVEDRKRGLSDKQQKVMEELDRLQRETGAQFTIQPRHQSTGAMDTRTILTADGKQTLYDKWQENYRALKPEDGLYSMVTQEIPDGTYGEKGVRVTLIENHIKKLQDDAFKQLMSDEHTVVEKYKQTVLDKAKGKFGLLDFHNLNK